MKLAQTKAALNRLQGKYASIFKGARDDLRPDYGNTGNGGYYYGNSVDDIDRDYIYNAISYLKEIFNNPDEVMYFDIKYYITEENALKAFDKAMVEILGGLANLEKMLKKYAQRNLEPYPVKSILIYFTEISEYLVPIHNSEEIKEFRNPGKLEKINAELIDLKVAIYWTKYKRSCIIHLICFFLFLIVIVLLVLHKEKKDFSGIPGDIIVIGVSVITILFNLLFNNHDSFKHSWKLFRRSTRQKLMNAQREKFLKENKTS